MRSRNSGPRSDAWSRNKRTNLRPFDPQHEEISGVIEQYFEEYSNADKLIVRQRSLHESFIMPVTQAEVECTLETIPARFLEGLKAVFLLGGSKRQEDAFATFCYGRYSSDKIFLHPYPKKYLRRRYASPPKPHVLIEYQRAGAVMTNKPGEFIVEFTEGALRQFYLRDVLIHEIGHHVDRCNFGRKPRRKEESFAEWFATEYGFRQIKV